MKVLMAQVAVVSNVLQLAGVVVARKLVPGVMMVLVGTIEVCVVGAPFVSPHCRNASHFTTAPPHHNLPSPRWTKCVILGFLALTSPHAIIGFTRLLIARTIFLAIFAVFSPG